MGDDDNDDDLQNLGNTTKRLGWLGVFIVLSVIGLFQVTSTATELQQVVAADVSPGQVEAKHSYQNWALNGTHSRTSTKAPNPSSPGSSASSENEFDWNDMASRICPDMVPNVALAPKLFQLARDEIPGENATCPTAGSTDIMANQFFGRNWGVKGYVTDQQHWFGYVPIWKCANDELRRYLEKFFVGNNIKFDNPMFDRNKGLSCIVTAIRDPVSHFLSGYNEIEFRINKYKRFRSATTWNFHHTAVGSPRRFEQFLTDVLSCPFERGWKGIYKTWDQYPSTLELPHVYSMTNTLHHLATSTNVIPSEDFHYLPTLTNLSYTFGPFVVDQCPPGTFSDSMEKQLREGRVGINHHESSADPTGSHKAAKRVWTQGSSFSRALCALHIMDYACWKNLPDGVPTVCMELYESYDKRGIL